MGTRGLWQHPGEFMGGREAFGVGVEKGRRAGDGTLDSHSGQLYLTRISL